MHMAKIRTTITINKDLLKKAQKYNISISSFLDIELRRYIALIENGVRNKEGSDAGNGIRTRVTSLGS
jgi:post-segregation antitoxin (ccd killing protein)